MPAAIVAPSCWASDAPAPWKRAPSIVTTRRSGRSAPRRAIHPATASSSASSASAVTAPAAASPNGSAPSEPAWRCSPTASAAACQRAPAWRTTGARSSMTPSSAVPTTSAVTAATLVRSRMIDVAPRSSSSTARPGPAAASTRWRTSHPSAWVPAAVRPRSKGALPGKPAASGAGASAAVYRGSRVMPSYVVVRSRAMAASGVSSPLRSSALATAAAHCSRSAGGNSPARTRSVGMGQGYETARSSAHLRDFSGSSRGEA